MSADYPTKNRAAVIDLLDADIEDAAEAERIGQELVHSGGLVRDVGTSIREVVKKLPSDDMLTDKQWNHMNEAWRSVKESAQPVIATKPYVADYFSVASGTTVSTIATVYAISPVTPAFQPVVTAVKAQLASIANATAQWTTCAIACSGLA
jgi:hypothetical protein